MALCAPTAAAGAGSRIKPGAEEPRPGVFTQAGWGGRDKWI